MDFSFIHHFAPTSRLPEWGIPLLMALILALPGSATSEDASEDNLRSADTNELVARLGATSYEVREKVADELLRRGIDAKPELLAALKNADLEVRLRAQHLLVAISRSEINRRLEAFVDDDALESDYDLPSWTSFHRTAGGNRPARKLFAQMVRAEPDLLVALESDTTTGARILADRIRSLQMDPRTRETPNVSSGSLAAILFAASRLEAGVNQTIGSQLFHLLNRAESLQFIHEGSQTASWRRLLGAWLNQCVDNPALAMNGLLLTMRHNFSKVGLELGRKVVAGYVASTTVQTSLPYAVLTIGKFGGTDDLELLESLLNNDLVCHAWTSRNIGKTIQIQIRDVALVCLVHLTQQDHRHYGFGFLQPSEDTLFQVFTCGFESPEQRERALLLWQEWTEKNQRPAGPQAPLPAANDPSQSGPSSPK